MTDRFADLRKIPNQPAIRLLAIANAKIATPLTSPAAAAVAAVLKELQAKAAVPDMLRLLAAALPAREAIWWGCLAAGDLVPPGAPVTRALAAARAWVFEPTDANREAARAATENADPDDDTTLIASACVMCDGKLGTGDMAAFDAPAGAVATLVFSLNVMSLSRAGAEVHEAQGQMLIDRALDIARGGDGQKVVASVAERVAS